MSDTAAAIERLRRTLGRFLPDAWLLRPRSAVHDPMRRRPAGVRIELRPEAPARSWVVWEVSRRLGDPPPAAGSSRVEGSEQ